MQHLWLVTAAPCAVYTLVRSAILKVLTLQAAGAPPAIHCTVSTRARKPLYIPEVAAGTIVCADLTRCAASPKQRLPRVLVAYHLGLRHEQAICMSCTALTTTQYHGGGCQQQVCLAQCEYPRCVMGACTASQYAITSWPRQQGRSGS